MATRNASAQWSGDLKEGTGKMALGSGAWEGPFTYKSRFEDGAGTNPEELIGAAHAGCFTMQLSAGLAADGHVVDSVKTEARVQLRIVDDLPTITQIDLVTRAACPASTTPRSRRRPTPPRRAASSSRALAGVGNITLDAELES